MNGRLMAIIIEMPKLSDTMTEGTLVRWLKKEGDKVRTGDVLAEVETDKATMEMAADDEGILGKIYVPAGSKAGLGVALRLLVGLLRRRLRAGRGRRLQAGVRLAVLVAG